MCNAATVMDALAAEQPGYRGMDSVRGADADWASRSAIGQTMHRPRHGATMPNMQ